MDIDSDDDDFAAIIGPARSGAALATGVSGASSIGHGRSVPSRSVPKSESSDRLEEVLEENRRLRQQVKRANSKASLSRARGNKCRKQLGNHVVSAINGPIPSTSWMS